MTPVAVPGPGPRDDRDSWPVAATHATRASVAELRKLDATQLAQLHYAGDVDVDTLLAIDRADQRAARQRARADAERSAWHDAAYAQWQAAETACRGNLYSPYGLAELDRIARETGQAAASDGMALWRGADDWAERRASPELLHFWEHNGGRLSLAAYRRQQALAARAYRAERDLDRMAAAPERTERRAPSPVATVRPPAAPRPAGSIARYIGAMRAATASTDLLSARIDALAARLAARHATTGGAR